MFWVCRYVEQRTRYMELSKYTWNQYVEHSPSRMAMREQKDTALAKQYRESKKRTRYSNPLAARGLGGAMAGSSIYPTRSDSTSPYPRTVLNRSPRLGNGRVVTEDAV